MNKTEWNEKQEYEWNLFFTHLQGYYATVEQEWMKIIHTLVCKILLQRYTLVRGLSFKKPFFLR